MSYFGVGMISEPSYTEWCICGLQNGFCNYLQGANNSERVVKKARMDKLGTESGVYDDSWYSRGKEDLKMGS
jgi:hypothetical protein